MIENGENKKNKIRSRIILAAILIIIIGAATAWFVFYNNDQPQDVYVAKLPRMSMGCDRVIWNDEQLEIKPSINNIDNPLFEWLLDGKHIGSNTTLKQRLDIGEYKIYLNVDFSNQTLEDNMSVVVIDSTKGVSIYDSQESKNRWKFQTQYGKKNAGIKGASVYVDSLQKKDTDTCGYVGAYLLSGDHTWRAEYHGEILSSGKFSLKQTDEVKIAKVDVGSKYRVGDTVNGKIILKNTGTTVIKKFSSKTRVINHKYEWMGDVAKKEYNNEYNVQLNPGDAYDIPVVVKIPKSVNGIEPTGKYSIAVDISLNGDMMDSKTVSTEVTS